MGRTLITLGLALLGASSASPGAEIRPSGWFETAETTVAGNALFVLHLRHSSLLLDARGLRWTRGSGPAGKDDFDGNADGSYSISFVGGRPAEVLGLDLQVGRSNYLIGNEPGLWVVGRHHFGGVLYRQVYEGVDAYVSPQGDQVRVEFVLEAAALASSIDLLLQGDVDVRLKGNGGANIVEHDSNQAVMTLSAPIGIGIDRDSLAPVAVGYEARDDRHIGFCVAGTRPGLPLLIDPTVEFATYYGGNDYEEDTVVAVDPGGNIYLAGYTASPNFPIKGGVRSTLGLGNAFVVKLDSTGKNVIYSTYLGGNSGGYDAAHAIAVDVAGNAYVAGTTSSTDFPAVNAFQKSYGGARDGFIAKLAPDGSSLVYSTYLGGSNDDNANAIAVDGYGRVTVAGDTTSVNFPVSNALQSLRAGLLSGFVSSLSPDGRALLYSTYLGGTQEQGTGAAATQAVKGLALDPIARPVLVGWTTAVDFPVQSGFQPSYGGGFRDAFLVRLTADGSSLDYSTYLGGFDADKADAVAVDRGGNMYVAGDTSSTNFPLKGALQGVLDGSQDAFVSKVSPDGSELVYSTFFGGSGTNWAGGIAVGFTGRATISGYTTSTNLPLFGATQSTNAGGADAFCTTLDETGSSLTFSTYVGGSADEYGLSVALDEHENQYLAGYTTSSNFPVVNALYGSLAGKDDAFLVKFAPSCALPTDVGNTVMLRRSGMTSAAVYWKNVSGATNYRLFEDLTSHGPFLTGAGSGASGVPGTPWAPAAGALVFLRVVAENACGLGPR